MDMYVCTYACVLATVNYHKIRLIDLEIRHAAATLSPTHKVAGPNAMMTIAMCNRINLLASVNYEGMEVEVKSGQ
jgi:predicted signal transduction protein with EAL and GGDEF domain